MRKTLSREETLQLIKHLEIPIDLTSNDFWWLHMCLNNQINHIEDRPSGWEAAIPYNKLHQRLVSRPKDNNRLLVVNASEHGLLQIAINTYIRDLHGLPGLDIKALSKKLDVLLDRSIDLAIATNAGEQGDIGEI
jgi:hypothetical protein